MSSNSGIYSDSAIEIMREFDSLPDMSMNRIEIIKELAKNTGVKKIGIAHCIMFRSEAQTISKYLSKDFKVYTVDCKYGNLSRKELLGSGGGTLCNPGGQAEYLNSKNCEMNISIGLCVGHDMIFNKCSKGYVTNLFSKDFTNGNDTEAALYEISNSI